MKIVDDDKLAYMLSKSILQATTMMVTDASLYVISSIHKGTKTSQFILEFPMFIDLSSNHFKGEIPEIMGNLGGLQSLNLSNNIVIGQIPPSLANLTNVEVLDLCTNNLSGEIPNQLSLLTFLSDSPCIIM